MVDEPFRLTISEQVSEGSTKVREVDDLTSKEIAVVLRLTNALDSKLRSRRTYLKAHRVVLYLVAYRGIGAMRSIYLKRKDATTIVGTHSLSLATKFSLDEALELVEARPTHDKRHGPVHLISDQVSLEQKPVPTLPPLRDDDDDLNDDDDDFSDETDEDYFTDPPVTG